MTDPVPSAASADADMTSGPAPTRKVYVKSYGCQMNVYDSQRMVDVLAETGAAGATYAEVQSPEEADLILLNTCHIRERAAEKVYSELGKIRQMKETARAEGREVLVGVTGCVAQAEGAEIVRRAPVVDLVVGPQSYHRLPDLVTEAAGRTKGSKGRPIDIDFPVESKFDALPQASRIRTRARGVSAFLTVQEGCDKFCTFCVVPYTRGAEVSRPVEAVLAEARALAQAGVREVSVLGQNVNAYHGEGPDGREWTLARLLTALAEIPGLARLRYTTSHPNEMTDDLIAAHRDLPQLMPYLHLPVQSGSNRILKAMNRRHTRDAYLSLIDRMREARPDVALTSDFIVGFPGETDQDHADTMDLITRVGYAASYSFSYSTRPGTPGADLPDQIPEPVKRERLHALQALISAQQSAFLAACIGRTLPVLFEKAGRKPGQVVGRTPYLATIAVDDLGAAEGWTGRIADVTVTRTGTNTLHGVLSARDPV